MSEKLGFAMGNHNEEELTDIAFHLQQMIFVVWWVYAWATVHVVISDLGHRPLVWDWRFIDYDDIAFPCNFLWGVASAAHQVSVYYVCI